MKMIKAMKKLKFWSRKKKKKRSPFFVEQSPPSCHYHHHCHYHPVEPSAPPLPSWLDYDQTQETISASDAPVPSSSQDPFITTHDKVPQLLSPQNSTLEEDVNSKNTTSYQQYMVENPVYGVPVEPSQVTSERDAGAFGCVFSFGTHLFRCFFPCFHIREAK